MKKIKPYIDKVLNIVVSKKLTVFAVASVALFTGDLTSGDWKYIACLYMLGLVFLNWIDPRKGNKNLSEEREDGLK